MLAKMGTVCPGLILSRAGECRAEQHPFCSRQQVVQERGAAEGWGDMGMMGGWGGRGKPFTWPLDSDRAK